MKKIEDMTEEEKETALRDWYESYYPNYNELKDGE